MNQVTLASHLPPSRCRRLACALTLLLLAACGSEEPASTPTDAGAQSQDVAADAGSTDAGTSDSGSAGTTDSGSTDAGTADAGSTDAGSTDAGSTDAGATDAGSTDAGSTDAGSTDAAGSDASAPTTEVAKLVMENQTLATQFKTIAAKLVALPPSALKAGKLNIYGLTGGKKGPLAGTLLVAVNKTYTDEEIVLKDYVVGQQDFVAELIQGDGKPFQTLDGAPLVANFQVTGDLAEPELLITSQSIPASDLYTLTVHEALVPERFSLGLWVAIYADDKGKPGAYLGKVKLLKGAHKDVALKLNSKLVKGQTLHAILREGTASGGWTSKGVIATTLDGQPVQTTFEVDSPAFHPVLEIDDQTLSDPKEIKVKLVTIPKEHFAGWVAVYADKDGKPGDLLGKLQYTTGTKKDKIVKLTVAQQGDKTLHAILHAGQKWADAEKVIMKAPGGGEMTTTFKIGAQSLSYIIAQPYTTKNPRHIMVTRAYSYDKPAWVVLARDDNGKPGTLIAQKKVLKKFAGNVHFTMNTNDILQKGTTVEYLTSQPDTFRRCARGVDKLHVLLYEDFPQDNKFTYKPGGTEDLPVLDANKKPVTALLTVTVKASILNTQKWSPRYYYPCPLTQHVGNPTALPVDCRCHANLVTLDFPECKSVIADYLKMEIGEGPRARTQNFGGFYSGFAEKDELIALVKWKDHKTKWPENQTTIDVGAVMGIDVKTRKRRIIGGRYNDPSSGIKDIGKGPVLSYPFEIQKGPDGKYYVGVYTYVRINATLVPGVDIIRMDPKTGDREYAWRSNHLGFNFENKKNPYGHCPNGRTEKFGYWSVQIGRKGFGIDDKGNFYLSYAHNGATPTSNGVGILKVSADGKQCDIVTSTGVGKDNVVYKGKNVGTGPVPQAGPYKGMLVKDGKIYTSTGLTGDLYEIDVATGNRKLLHKKGTTDNNSGSSGTHVLWDPYRKLIWQGGLSGATLLFDPSKGTSEPLWCPQNYRDYKGIGCVQKGAWGWNGMPMERGMWLHPTDKDYAFVVNGPLITRVHLPSGTSEIFSY